MVEHLSSEQLPANPAAWGPQHSSLGAGDGAAGPATGQGVMV